MNYFNFSGRARRQEYWMFILVNAIITIVIAFLAALIKYPALLTIYQLGTMIPAIAVGVRRMHDSDHVGYWIALPFYNIYLLAINGTQATNRFGPDPKATVSAIAPPQE